jgi:hypothetical protein
MDEGKINGLWTLTYIEKIYIKLKAKTRTNEKGIRYLYIWALINF